MSPRRRFQTDVPETEDPDGSPRDGGSRQKSPRRTTQTDVPEMEGQEILAFRLMSMCAICLALRLETDVQTDVPETEDPDGGPRRMQQTDVPKRRR